MRSWFRSFAAAVPTKPARSVRPTVAQPSAIAFFMFPPRSCLHLGNDGAPRRSRAVGRELEERAQPEPELDPSSWNESSEPELPLIPLPSPEPLETSSSPLPGPLDPEPPPGPLDPEPPLGPLEPPPSSEPGPEFPPAPSSPEPLCSELPGPPPLPDGPLFADSPDRFQEPRSSPWRSAPPSRPPAVGECEASAADPPPG